MDNLNHELDVLLAWAEAVVVAHAENDAGMLAFTMEHLRQATEAVHKAMEITPVVRPAEVRHVVPEYMGWPML